MTPEQLAKKVEKLEATVKEQAAEIKALSKASKEGAVDLQELREDVDAVLNHCNKSHQFKYLAEKNRKNAKRK